MTPMDKNDTAQRIADYLDGLLEGEEAAEVERLLLNDPASAAEARRVRALLYTAYPVPPAPPDLAPRAWALARPQRLPALLRYAAAFAAGALFMLLLRDRPAPPEPAPVADSTPLVFENRIVR